MKILDKEEAYKVDKEEVYKSGVRFPSEVCSPWDLVKAIEWAMIDHVRKFHTEDGGGE